MAAKLDDLTDYQLGNLVASSLRRALDIDLHMDCAEPAGDGERQVGEAIRAAFNKNPDEWTRAEPDEDAGDAE